LFSAYVPGRHAEQKLLFEADEDPGGHAAHALWLPPSA
jgi:hypothetical protein